MKHTIYTLLLLINAATANQDFFIKQDGGITFPQGFLKGVASSTYQNGGHHFAQRR